MICCIEEITVGVKRENSDCVLPVEKVDFGHNVDVGVFFGFISSMFVLVVDMNRYE